MTSTRTSRFAQRLAIGLGCAALLGGVALGGYNLASADVSSGERPVFIPINPCRLLDTRPSTNVGPQNGPIGATTLSFVAHGSNGECTRASASAIPTDAVGLSMNVTAIRPSERTFLTFWGGGGNPGTANLNPEPGQSPTPNSVNTPLSGTGTFNLRNNAGSVHVTIDVNGYYADHNHDDRYLTEAKANDRYLTETQASITYLTETQAGDTYVTVNELGNTNFLASGRVQDPAAPTGNGSAQKFSAPAGVTATFTDKSEEGLYTVTLNGLDQRLEGVVQVTAVAEESPPTGTSAARACAISAIRPSASSFSVDIGCFGEDDDNPGIIVAEDSSFEFLITG